MDKKYIRLVSYLIWKIVRNDEEREDEMIENF